MQGESKGRPRGLERGQLWKLEHGYVHIVDSGNQLVRYRLLDQPNQRTAVTQLIGIEALLNYLQQSEAELLNLPN